MPTYTCDLCGGCCCTFPIFAAEADATREPRVRMEGKKLEPWLATPLWRYQLYPLPFHEACCFLGDENRCTIYETRPDVCRAFAPGSPQCQEARASIGVSPLQPTDVTST
jgi:Fe-S-cluster containining protein